MESKSFENILQKSLIGAGLGGWFGGIYGINSATIDPSKERTPFQRILHISQKGTRCGLIGAAGVGAITFALKYYEMRD